jgi:hypothetical protein
MQCAAGVIAVADAVYGRPADTKCGGPVGACNPANVASMVRGKCEGLRSCILTADTWRTNDPCPNVLKELVVDFKCRGECVVNSLVSAAGHQPWMSVARWVLSTCAATAARIAHPLLQKHVRCLHMFARCPDTPSQHCSIVTWLHNCNHTCQLAVIWTPHVLLLHAVNDGTTARVCDTAAPVTIQCSSGVIAVSSTTYTRPTDTQCPGPAGECSRTIDLEGAIKARCDGQASCTLMGDTYKTSDPCLNILKELRVDYKCQAGAAACNEATM